MEPVARYFLGDPNPRLSTRDELRWGSNGSLSVKPGDDQFYNHETKEGGGVVAFTMSQQLTGKAEAVAFLKENWPDHVLPKANGDGRLHGHGRGVIEKTYDYVDEHGELLYQVVRKRDPKTFLQRRPVPKSAEHPDGWDWSVKGVRPVIYKLPQVLAAIAKGRTVHIVEGEKDADRLWKAGLVATTNAGGAGKWRPELNEQLRGADAVVIGDNDVPGQQHADHVAGQVGPFAKRLRRLPTLAEVWPECPAKGDVSDFLDAGYNVVDLAALLGELPDYRPAADDTLFAAMAPLAISAIPPRRWAYGKFLLFGSAAVMGAGDGVGKGVITVGMILSMITGQALLGERIWRTGPPAIVTYEDDEMEWRRRIAAGCLYYNLDYDQIIRSVYFVRHPRRVSFGQMDGGRLVFPDSDAIIADLIRVRAALLVIDPFNGAHRLESGNENVVINQIATEIGRIAQVTDAAVMANHHLRKGAVGAVDDLMGATALRANFRSCRILMRMTTEQADLLNIPTDEVYRYIRIVGSKENYAPPPEKSAWFKLQSQALGNGTDEYPDGDDAPVAVRWEPPVGFAGVSLPKVKAIFDALREGPGEGWCYSLDRGKYKAADLIMEKTGVSKAQAGSMLRMWQESGVFRERSYTTPTRNQSTMVVLDEAKVAAILAELRVFDEDLTSL